MTFGNSSFDRSTFWALLLTGMFSRTSLEYDNHLCAKIPVLPHNSVRSTHSLIPCSLVSTKSKLLSFYVDSKIVSAACE